MPYGQSLGYVSDNRGREEYATNREEMVQGDSDEVFETDLDRLPRGANPGTVVTGAFLQDPERMTVMIAANKNLKDLPVPHIEYRSAFGVKILNSWLNEVVILAYGLF
jgi:hypothetical protein